MTFGPGQGIADDQKDFLLCRARQHLWFRCSLSGYAGERLFAAQVGSCVIRVTDPMMFGHIRPSVELKRSDGDFPASRKVREIVAVKSLSPLTNADHSFP